MTALREVARVAQAVGVATCISVGGSLGLDWPFYVALPAGFVVGVTFATVAIVRDRRRAPTSAGAKSS